MISEFLILVATWTVAKRYLKFSVNLKNLAKIIFSALVMGAAVHYLQPYTYELIENWSILLLIPLGGAIYVAMLFLTKTVDKEMLALIRRK